MAIRGSQFKAIGRAHSVKTAALIGTGLACAIASQAFAQEVAGPAREVVDKRGVDVVTGKAKDAMPSIQVGPASFSRDYAGLRRNSRLTSFISQSGTDRIVVIDGVSKRFIASGSNYVAVDGDGSALVLNSGVYTYTTRTGDVFTFSNIFQSSLHPYWVGVAAVLTSIVNANGNRTDYRYDTATTQDCGRIPCVTTSYARVLSIAKSDGAVTRPGYAGDVSSGEFNTLTSATIIDRSVDYCDPAASSCTTTQTWPALTYTGENVTEEENVMTTATVGSNGVSAIDRPDTTSTDVAMTYQADGKVATVTQDGITYNYAYAVNGANQTTTITTPNGTETYVVDTTTTRPVSTTNAAGLTTSYLYDTSGRTTRITFPELNYVNYTYDARGNITEVRQVAKPGSGVADIVATASFDATCVNTKTCNKPNYTIDERGNRTDFTYDPTHGGVTRIQSPAPASGQPRPEIDYTYSALTPQVRNSSGVLVSTGVPQYLLTQVTMCATAATCPGTANETRITYVYNTPTLQLTSVTVAAGDNSVSATHTYTYNLFGKVASDDGPLPGSDDTTYYFYYPRQQKVRGIIYPDPDGAGPRTRMAVRYTRDRQGRLTAEAIGNVTGTTNADLMNMAPLQQVDHLLDGAGRNIRDTLTAGGTVQAVTQQSYDTTGRLDCVAQRMNLAAFASLPASACTLGTAGSDGPDRLARYTYDGADRATQLRTAYGTADEVSEAFTYTANSQVMTVKDGENNLTTYEYDGQDRLLKTRYPLPAKGSNASSTTDYEQLSYDAASNVTSRRLRDGNSIVFAYDNLGRLTYVDRPGSEVDNSATYNLLGQPTLIQDSAGGYVGYAWNALGRQTAESSPLGVFGKGYDAAGNLNLLVWPDNFFVNYDYDTTGNVTAIRENGATSGIGVLASYAYDGLGRRTTATFGNGTSRAYDYDPANRLKGLSIDLAATAGDLLIGQVGASGSAITYNAASQITQIPRSNDAYAWTGHYNVERNTAANGLNQYGQIATVGGSADTPSYDARGNLTAAGGVTYSYNSLNQLTSVSSSAPLTYNGTLAYDAAGRLEKLISGAATTRFGYSGTALMAETDGAGTMLRRYVHGPGTDEPIVWYEGAGTASRRWLQADERGSVVAVTDANGAVLATNRYDEYGIGQTGNLGRFRYTGQAALEEIGLLYYKARMYSPGLGRFMQTDPIGYGDGLNWYSYVWSDPVNLVDPTGLDASCGTGYHLVPTNSPQPGPSTDGSINVNSMGHCEQLPTIPMPRVLRTNTGGGGGGAPHRGRRERQSCIVNKFSRVGNQLQNYGLGFGLSGAVVTAAAPEAGAGEAGVEFGVALYAGGTALKDSVSITNLIFNGGNASGFALGKVNDFILRKFPEGLLKDAAGSILDRAEHSVGLDKGDEGGC